MISLATLDPDAPVFPGASVSNATDAKVTLAGLAERRLSVEADPVEIDAAYAVLAALGRVVASATLPDAIYTPTLDTRLGSDIVSDLDRATDTIREWFCYLYG